MPPPCETETVLRSHVRPDLAFWRGMWGSPERVSDADLERRERTTRFALGVAFLITSGYLVASFWAGPNFVLQALVNGGAAGMYAGGSVAASRGAHRGARTFLMLGMVAHFVALVVVTGEEFRSHNHAIIGGALACVLFTRQERWQRRFYIAVFLAIVLWGELAPPASLMDLSGLAPWIRYDFRVANLVLPTVSVLALLQIFGGQVQRSEVQLTEERQRSDQLLHAVLPGRIAQQLREGARAIAEHAEVTVLFADLVGFTPWSARHTPEQVIALLEQVFSRFDVLVGEVGAEKIKTIGDAYMVVCGAPEAREDHAPVMARLALAMVKEMRRLREETGVELELRVGLNSGPAIAGVIGTVRFAYDIWGDTVNTASRMESHGEPGRIQVSAATRELLASDWELEPRGPIEVKGKGTIEAFWLRGPRPSASSVDAA